MRINVTNSRVISTPLEEAGHNVGWWQVPKVLTLTGKPGPTVYFADRIEGRSHVFSFDLNDALEPITETLQLRFSPSEALGTFDDEGVMPADFVSSEVGRFFFYSGWNSRNTTPYHNSTGLARVTDDGELVRFPDAGPIMERNFTFPYLAVTPTVWRDGNFHCLYVNGDRWFKSRHGGLEPIYSLRYATSTNLTTWHRHPDPLLPNSGSRVCHSNPCHIRLMGEDLVFFCDREAEDYRDSAERGYDIQVAKFSREAPSLELLELTWSQPRLEGFNDLMRAYPEVFSWRNKLYMLTNGNGFGQSGLLLSELEVL